MDVQGPWFNLKEAAEYCSYDPNYFGKLLQEYEVPRHGPGKNRYAKTIIDEFMKNPDTFKKKEEQKIVKYKPKPLKV